MSNSDTFSMPIVASSVPCCNGMLELPSAAAERARLSSSIQQSNSEAPTPLSIHLSHGLAYTIGSALGSTPPSVDLCLSAFIHPNKAGLTAGARAWSKHSHRSQPQEMDEEEQHRSNASSGWWGTPSGPVATINEKALDLFWKVTNNATWRNLHWLPHRVLVYEVRVLEGYGMRWSRDQGSIEGDDAKKCPWTFRGFIEPMMENGHELGWKH